MTGDRRPNARSTAWVADQLAADVLSWQLGVEPADIPCAAVAVRRALRTGRGFAHLRGFPVGDRELATRTYEALAAAIGRLLPQNRDGDALHYVRAQAGKGAERRHGSKGSGELLFHTDQAASPPDRRPRVLGLLALDRAAHGGTTRLVSGESVVARVEARLPGADRALRTPVAFARDDGLTDAAPVLAPLVRGRPDGRPALRYNRYFTEVGARRAGTPLPETVSRALDAFDRELEDSSLVHEVLLEPGEAVFIDNLAVLHDRTAYVDDDLHQRCLVRAWTT
jgi:alpha-ketoglutarate-dependent taurine dioxygenase